LLPTGARLGQPRTRHRPIKHARGGRAQRETEANLRAEFDSLARDLMSQRGEEQLEGHVEGIVESANAAAVVSAVGPQQSSDDHDFDSPGSSHVTEQRQHKTFAPDRESTEDWDLMSEFGSLKASLRKRHQTYGGGGSPEDEPTENSDSSLSMDSELFDDRDALIAHAVPPDVPEWPATPDSGSLTFPPSTAGDASQEVVDDRNWEDMEALVHALEETDSLGSFEGVGFLADNVEVEQVDALVSLLNFHVESLP
jgi:hypothetical protein